MENLLNIIECLKKKLINIGVVAEGKRVAPELDSNILHKFELNIRQLKNQHGLSFELEQLTWIKDLLVNKSTQPNCFVKFVPYNDRILHNLINKTIFFSKVYNFNDLNELPVLPVIDDINKENKQKIVDYLNICENRKNLLENIHKNTLLNDLTANGNYREYFNNITEFLNGSNFDVDSLSENLIETTLIAHIAFSKTGIFCISDIEVFNDDSAQLMFAHYADNLKGLALIYSIRNQVSPSEINYKLFNQLDVLYPSGSLENINNVISELIEGSNRQFFLTKTSKWNYEKEYRLFGNPGISNIEQYDLKLEGMFFVANRFDAENSSKARNILEKINNNFYNDELFVEPLRHGVSPKKLLLVNNTNEITHFINQEINN